MNFKSEEKRILVTGATGFVGAGVMRLGPTLSEVRLVGMARNVAKDFEIDRFVRCDVADVASLNDLSKAESYETVIHAAGLAHQFGETSAAEFQRVNVSGTENICRFAAATGARRLVLVSSVSVYGERDAESSKGRLVDESFECRPTGPYAESKFDAERAASALCAENGIELIVLRLATVIGAGDRGNTARLVKAIDGRKFIWIGDGSNRKTLIDKDDAAAAIVLAATAESRPGRKVFNVCAPPVTMGEIVGTIAGACDRRIWPLKLPGAFALATARLSGRILGRERGARYETTIGKWLSDDVFDGTRFNDSYGWRPAVPIAESLGAQVREYLSEKNILPEDERNL